MASQTGQQTIKTCILPNISRSKNNLTMKFFQLKEYNKRNCFLKISYKNMVEKIVPDFFIKKLKIL